MAQSTAKTNDPSTTHPTEDVVEETGPQYVRITNHGKMRHWVDNSLKFLEEHPNRPLILHTLPYVPSSSDPQIKERKRQKQENTSTSTDATVEPAPEGAAVSTKPGNINNATLVVPRLISVVELIKREFLARQTTRIEGLHQYNELGCLEDLGLAVSEGNADENETRAQEILRALEGKNHLARRQTPFMRITLSVNPLAESDIKDATYQPPQKRKLSKSAKQRAKKRAKQMAGAVDGPSSAASKAS